MGCDCRGCNQCRLLADLVLLWRQMVVGMQADCCCTTGPGWSQGKDSRHSVRVAGAQLAKLATLRMTDHATLRMPDHTLELASSTPHLFRLDR